jgi:hypothetical protein
MSEATETSDRKLVNWEPVAERLGYKSKHGFWLAVHQLGIPHIRFNARRIRFVMSDVESWLKTRCIGT